jgi:hypothetical protein
LRAYCGKWEQLAKILRIFATRINKAISLFA